MLVLLDGVVVFVLGMGVGMGLGLGLGIFLVHTKFRKV